MADLTVADLAIADTDALCLLSGLCASCKPRGVYLLSHAIRRVIRRVIVSDYPHVEHVLHALLTDTNERR